MPVPAGRHYDPSKLTDARARADATPDDAHFCRLPLRIVVVPSWFPSPRVPLAGICLAEQTELLAKHAPSIDVHVFAVPKRHFDIRDRVAHPTALADAMSRLARGQFDRAAIRRWFESAYASSAVVPRLEHLYREVLATR